MRCCCPRNATQSLFHPPTLRSLLRSCTGSGTGTGTGTGSTILSPGKQLHAVVLTTGLASYPTTFLLNALLHFYSLRGRPTHARYLFDQIPHPNKDAADWTAFLACLVRHGGDYRNGFLLLREMKQSGVVIDDGAMACAFKLCGRVGDLGVSRQVHGWLVRLGFGFSVKACNALMDMYVKCGSVEEARRVFEEMDVRNVVSWSVLLDGSVRLEGVENGRTVFDEMPEKNVVGWTTMISGYVGSGFSKEGFSVLNEMVCHMGLTLNFVSLCSILSACAQMGDLAMGRWVHVYALKTTGMEMDIMVGTALVDMYAKCGRINMAYRVFRLMPRRNEVAWNAMLNGLAMHGRGKTVLEEFPKMIEEAKPDDLTFMAVLSACSHSGLVDQGRHYFYSLKSEYGITPTIEHYACMVDLLGRAGHFEEAEYLIRKMPMPPNEVLLGSILGSCSVHGKLHLGDRILKELLQVDPHNIKYHVLLSNMYALSGNQEKANSLRQVLISNGIKKVPGMSSIHINGELHQFSAGDKSHPRTNEIYHTLDDMIHRLRLAGYVPNASSLAFPGCDGREINAEEMEEQEQALFSHSEKLALCFGLASTRQGTPIVIFKNLRTCQDCHRAIKIASRVYNREIVVRDRNRFHCFKDGSCSCSDYW